MALAAIPIRSGRRLTRHSQTLLIPMGQIAGYLGEPECARFCSGLVRRGVCRRTSANAPRRRKAGFPQIGCPKLILELRLAASALMRRRPGAALTRTAFPQVRACSSWRRMRDSNPRGREPNPLSKSALGRSVKAKTTPRVGNYQHGMNPAERSRMRLKLRLALMPNGAIQALE